MPSEEAVSTSGLSNACLKCLHDICSLLHRNPEREAQFDVTYSAIYDEFARFKIWADGIGALQPDYSSVSLTQRLKNAPRTADEIVELLKDLDETLVDGELSIPNDVTLADKLRVISIISEKQGNRTHEFNDLLSAQESSISSTEGSNADVSAEDPNAELSEIQDLFQLISELNTNLFRASSKIRSNTPRDRYVRAATALPELKAQFNTWDYAHILSKYIKLQPQEDDRNWFAERLARAITWRRQYLRYCQNHSLKLATVRKQQTPIQSIHIRQMPTMNVSELQVATSIVEPAPPSVTTLTTPSTFVEEKKIPEVSRNENPVDEVEEVAPSTLATSVGTVEGESSAIIRLEKVRKGNYEFTCLFCTQPQKFRSNHAWQ